MFFFLAISITVSTKFSSIGLEMRQTLDSFEMYPPAGETIKILLTNVKKLVNIPYNFSISYTKTYFSHFWNRKVYLNEEECKKCIKYNFPFATFSFIPQMPSKAYYVVVQQSKNLTCAPKMLRFSFFSNIDNIKKLTFQTDFLNVTFLEQRITFGEKRVFFDTLEVDALNPTELTVCLSKFLIVS